MSAHLMERPTIAITMGDPCGIGPEVIVKALDRLFIKSEPGFSAVICASPAIMEYAADKFGSPLLKARIRAGIKHARANREARKKSIFISPASRLKPATLRPGNPGAVHGKAALLCLREGLRLVKQGICQALVTAPVTKSALKKAGFPYPGHTDFLERETGAPAVMMLAAGSLRVVPATVHIPLKQVPSALSKEKLVRTISLVDKELRQKFGIKQPRLAVSGLNPHAGEQGELGREEERIIEPALREAAARGIQVSGPFPADSLFIPENRKRFHAFICMFHDQALIPLKTLAMNRAVNVTLGLPFPRTSPAHGSAAQIAWQGKACPESMVQAIKLAVRLAGKQAQAKTRGSASVARRPFPVQDKYCGS